MELDKDTELSNGIMGKFLKDYGRMEQRMDLEYGSLQKEIFMKENGALIDNMEKVFISID